MELGIYSFGNTPHDPDGSARPTSEAITNLFEAIVLADELGLDFFGIGEHHTIEMPVSSPGAMIAAAAGATKQIGLGSTVTVLSTDDPVRVFQQFATADAISGGRVEITAGRGSSTESFPLFGYSLDDYDRLYAEKLDLLLATNDHQHVTWSGTVRPPLTEALVVPRPHSDRRLPIWLGTGGNPGSSIRAGSLGLPIAYGIISGEPHRFAPLAQLYRRAAAEAGHTGNHIRVSVAALGLIAPTKAEATERLYPAWHRAFTLAGRQRGWAPPTRQQFDRLAQHPGAYYAGDPDEVAERSVDLHRHLGHVRHLLQTDHGALPHEHFLESITLLATEVKPRVQRLLARD